MAGVKITAGDLTAPAVVPNAVYPANPVVGQTTNTLDAMIQILTRIERIVNSPTIQPIFKRALDKWENQNNLNGGQNMQPQQQTYNNPQVWDVPPKTQAQKPAEVPAQTTPPANTNVPKQAEFTEDQLRKYFPESEDVINFIDKLLAILPDEISTQEVALFISNYIGQLPNQKIATIRPIYSATKPLVRQQLAPIYARGKEGEKGAEKGGENANNNSN